MADTPTDRGSYRQQGLGDRLNTWGLASGINGAFVSMDEGIHGVETIDLTGNVTLTTTQYTTNQARNFGFILTDTGSALSATPVVTIPSVEGRYGIWNETGRDVSVGVSGGTAVTISDGMGHLLISDGSSTKDLTARRLDQIGTPTGTVSMGSQILTGVGTATGDSDAVRLDQMTTAIANAGGSAAGGTVMVTINDSTARYLGAAIETGDGITASTQNAGADETLKIEFDIPSMTALGAAPAAADALILYDDDASAYRRVVYSNLIPNHEITDSITAGSTQTQAGATALTTKFNRVTVSGTNGDGVKLPTAVANLEVVVINDDAAQTIQVWPNTSDAIDGGSADAVDANTIAAGSSRRYVAVDATNWYTASATEFDPASPGAIGGTTPAAGTFTTFTSSGIDDNATTARMIVADVVTLINKPVTGFTTVGQQLESSGLTSFIADSTGVGVYNRLTNDGTIITFMGQTVTEGTISISGSTVSYNGFMASHWGRFGDNSHPTVPIGTVMESTGVGLIWPTEGDVKHTEAKVSNATASPAVCGTFFAWDDEPDLLDRPDFDALNDFYYAAVGRSLIRMDPANPAPVLGDLVESAGNGFAKVQADDLRRSSTIGKIQGVKQSHVEPDGSYCVPMDFV
jgi:hypothetical protein